MSRKIIFVIVAAAALTACNKPAAAPEASAEAPAAAAPAEAAPTEAAAAPAEPAAKEGGDRGGTGDIHP